MLMNGKRHNCSHVSPDAKVMGEKSRIRRHCTRVAHVLQSFLNFKPLFGIARDSHYCSPHLYGWKRPVLVKSPI